jgi:uncharacterized protein YbdZ (MbtH family)
MLIMEKVAGTDLNRRRAVWLPVIPLALLLLLGGGQDSRSYVLEGPKWPLGSVIPFQLALGSAERTLVDGNTSWDTAAAPAPFAWDAVMGNLVLQTTTVSATAMSGDGQNTIVFANTAFGDSFGSRTLAETIYSFSGSTMQEADILFNNHQTWNSYRGALRYDGSGNAIAEIRRVLIHEMGHAIGLDHPDDHGQHVDAIMNSLISNRETLSADDIAGAQFLYGQPAAAVTVTTTPVKDFDGNGSPDLMLYNASTRQTEVWYLSNNVFQNNVAGPILPAGWRVAALTDFDHDGQLDYLLFNPGTHQSAIWYLSGTNFVSGSYGPTIASGYVLAGAADFNRDGNADYLLYSPSTGRTAIWYMNNNSFVGSAYGPTLPAGWKLVGTADFNRDGNVDYLLYNSNTRQSAIWYLSGTSYIGGAWGPVIASGYILIGTADFDGNGKPDYLLYNITGRQTAIWYLNNNVITSGAYGPPLPSGWGLAGPY